MQRSHASPEITLAPIQVAALLLVCLILIHGVDILTSDYSASIKVLTSLGLILLITTAARGRRSVRWQTIGILLFAVAFTGAVAWYPIYYWGTVASFRPAIGMTALLYLAIPSILIFMSRGYSFNVACFGAALISVVLGTDMVRRVSPYVRQPAFHLVYGNTRSAPLKAPTILPYSRFCHFYAWNPRGYFSQSPGGPLSPWLAWSMCLSTDRGTSAEFNSLGDLHKAIRISINQDPQQRLWHAVWTCSHWPIRSGESCQVRFRARADEQRPITVGVTKQNSTESVARGDYELTSEWKEFVLNFVPKDDVNLVELSFYLHPSTVPIELRDLEFTSHRNQVFPLIPITHSTLTSQCNDRGFRDRDYALPRPSDSFRIVCLGDSCTWGQGVKESETYSKRLEDLLNASSLGSNSDTAVKRFEVINTGRCGYATKEERLCFEHEASLYNPQMVVLQMLDNDNESTTAELMQQQVNDYSACLEEVKRLHDFCAARKIKLVILLFRYLPMTERWRSLSVTLSQGLEGRDIVIVDSGDAVAAGLQQSVGFLRDQPTVHPLDAHPNEIAHRIAAEVLFEAIERANLLKSPSDH